MRTQISIFLFFVLVLTHDVSIVASKDCSSKCGSPHGTGSCHSDGKCLCWWGWTGPNAVYVKSGDKKGRIMADHCQWACHYTNSFQNMECSDEKNGDCGGSDDESDGDD